MYVCPRQPLCPPVLLAKDTLLWVLLPPSHAYTLVNGYISLFDFHVGFSCVSRMCNDLFMMQLWRGNVQPRLVFVCIVTASVWGILSLTWTAKVYFLLIVPSAQVIAFFQHTHLYFWNFCGHSDVQLKVSSIVQRAICIFSHLCIIYA